MGQSWLVNDLLFTNNENPTYRIIDTGKLVITLYAWDQHGCIDSTTQELTRSNPATYFLPNAFTPNGDGKNEVFVGVGLIEDIRSFQMYVYDRWGQMVFTSTDPNMGWNGRQQNVGEPLPAGVYTYQGAFSFSDESPIYINGNIVLVR